MRKVHFIPERSHRRRMLSGVFNVLRLPPTAPRKDGGGGGSYVSLTSPRTALLYEYLLSLLLPLLIIPSRHTYMSEGAVVL